MEGLAILLIFLICWAWSSPHRVAKWVSEYRTALRTLDKRLEKPGKGE